MGTPGSRKFPFTRMINTKQRLHALMERLYMFVYRRMPFGLCNTSASFQRWMMAVFSEFIKEIVEVFMDDFSVYREDIQGLLGKFG
jgi:hypothetical protein